MVSVKQYFVWNLRHAVTLVLHQNLKAVHISGGENECGPIIVLCSNVAVCCTTPSLCSEAATVSGMWLTNGTSAGNVTLNDCLGTQKVDEVLRLQVMKGVQIQLLSHGQVEASC